MEATTTRRKRKNPENSSRGQPFGESSVLKVYPLVQAVVYSRLGQNFGEDVVGKVMEAILSGLSTTRASNWAEFRSWCYGIAFHKIRDVLRGKYSDRIQPMEPEELAAYAADESLESPTTIARKMDVKLLLATLGKSRFPCNRILADRFLLGLSPEELAHAYNVSKDAARMKVNRCLDDARDIARKLGIT